MAARCIMLAGLLAFLPAMGVKAQTTDIAVKAAFLPRFARYVEWPQRALPSGNSPFLLCLVGGDPFGRMVDAAAQEQSISGRAIIVRRLDSAAAAAGCHVAFVQGSRTQPIGQLLASLAQLPVLTVTDAVNGEQRGTIHFSVINGRVRFFIDEAAARRHGLTISSRLLALAVGVRH
jgi:hypothetical protein